MKFKSKHQVNLRHGYACVGGVAPEYRAWQRMLDRCRNPNAKKYECWGGRGIKVCKRWMKFENFFADMGPRPSPKHSLDRQNNDGHYTPRNCRWATASEQNGNRRTWSRAVRYNGLTVAEAARVEGVSKQTIYRRIYGKEWGHAA